MDEGLRHSLGYTVLQEICPLNPLIKLLAIISIISKGKADDPITALRAETRKDPAALQFILRYHLAGKQTLQQIIMKLLLQFKNRKLPGEFILESNNAIFNGNHIHVRKNRLDFPD